MGYSPPPGSAVTFNFTTLYSPPYGLNVVFNFGAISPPTGNANVFRALQLEIDEEAVWRDPRARQHYAVPVVVATIYPFVRRGMMLDSDTGAWTDPRARMRYSFPVTVAVVAVRPVLFTVM